MELSRLLSAPFRVFPHFIIVGAQKSGTTSLYHYLVQHPEMFPAYKKEINYFDTKFARGPYWYRSYFPRARDLKGGGVTGEASPCYLVDPQAARRISELLPEVKLIVLLRDPVYRTISSYYHSVRKGNETLSLEAALAAEDGEIGAIVRKAETGRRLSYAESKKLRRKSYLRRSLYAKQLSAYFRYFDRDQIFIESAEKLFMNPAPVIRDVLDFLGIDDRFTPQDLAARNVNDYPEIPERLITMLQEYFRPHNERLFDMLGKRFDWQ